MMVTGRTQTSITIRGELETLNYSTMTEAKVVVTEKKTGTVIKDEPLKLKSDYTFEIKCEDLTVESQYEFKIIAETSNGTYETKIVESTNPAERTYANITLVVNSDQYTTTTQKVQVGKTHTIRVQLNKSGYTFEGWYLDEEYTQPYTPGIIEEECEFTIYAKWVKTVVNTTTSTTKKTDATTSDTAASEMPDEPVSGGCGGAAAKSAEPVLIGGAVIAILGAVAGGKCTCRKNKSDNEE
jgi:uncharacterized repeat protein (TIGR02543 family)